MKVALVKTKKLQLDIIRMIIPLLALTSCQSVKDVTQDEAPQTQEKASATQRDAAAQFGALLNQVGLKKTISEYESLTALNPDDALAHLYLGIAYLMQSKQIDSLEQWNSNKNELSGIYNGLPESEDSNMSRRDEPASGIYLEKAIRSFERATLLDPGLFDAYLHLGNIAFNIHADYEKAAVCYKRSFELTGDPRIAGLLAASIRKQGAPKEARLLCENLLAGAAVNSSELYSQLALACMELSNNELAINYGQKAIDLCPGNIDAYISLAYIYREAGQFENSNAACDKGLELNPFVQVLYSSKGINYERLKHYDEALACHRKVLELDPYYYRAYNNIGVVLVLQGRTEEAIKPYQKAAQHLNDDYIHLNLISALQQLKQNQEAFEAADRYLQHFPKHPKISKQAGISLFDLGRFKEAKQYLNSSDKDNLPYLAAIELTEGNYKQSELLAREALALSETPASKSYNMDILSKVCLLQDKLDEALNFSIENEHIAQDEKLKYDAICRIGIVLEKKGELKGAISACDRAIALAPNAVDAYRNAAGFCFNATNHQQAFEYCKNLLALAPNDPCGLEVMGGIYRYKQPDVAAKYLFQSWMEDPTRSTPLESLCEMLILEQGKPAEAEPHLQKLEELFPDNWRTLSLRGLWLGTQNNPHAALPYFEKVAQLKPSGHTYNSLGYTQFLLKNYTAAEKAYTEGLCYVDSTGIIYFNLALLHRAQRNTAKALEFLNLAVKNGYPDNKQLRTELLSTLQPVKQ
ncbi:MAG: tetratricopeptide repeat protein [Kiritimatiellales bacterium]